ncbi:hypothetical protein FQP90_09445 [Paenarthrobacter nitroguajacolicus]|uniref:Uncharacterized protein n=1 Tax=Paenarthrobacter nitroguajacolicus TaxID=211146 RepID=A0A558H258_PAENT|nr:hypothetical protein [Paenarthrobacter nitroguajacolicus]TVU63210.1 hypothetical protein FQP90_09445 [Paenarthrobacter nitroguajacolicus]
MIARRLVIAGICLAVLIVAAAIVLDQMAGRPGNTSAQSSSSSGPSSSSSAPASGSATPSGAGAPTPGSPSSGLEGGSGENGNGGPSTAKPLEVLPPVTATPTGLPEPAPPAPLITGDLPQAGTASGEMVDGWPADIVSLPPGTTIGSTSVSTSGNVLQVSADGIIAKPQSEVLGSFRQSLVSHGFWSETAPAAEGAVAERFVRGTDTVTVSVSTTGTGASRFQLLGSLHTTAD